MGAKFNAEQKGEYSDIQGKFMHFNNFVQLYIHIILFSNPSSYVKKTAELASLQTKFMQNVLKDEEEWEIVLKAGDLEGCPPDLVAASRQAAIDRKKGEEDHVITLSRSMVEPCEFSSFFVA